MGQRDNMEVLSVGTRERSTEPVPGVAALALVPFWICTQKQWSFGWSAAFELAFAGAGLAYILWFLRRSYVRHARHAIRELDFADICPQCGYDVSAVSRPQHMCPESGTRFEPFTPANRSSVCARVHNIPPMP
jgi:hypothetical protein